MNMKRFTGRNSREAMQRVREAFGDDAIVLSNKPCTEGIEILALPPQGLDVIHHQADEQGERLTPERSGGRAQAGRAQAGRAEAGRGAGLQARAAAQHAEPETPAPTSVHDDVKRLSMSTLSFQDYVRERLLKRRQAALGKAEPRHVEPSFDAPPMPAPSMTAPALPPKHEPPAQALAQRLAQRAQERAQSQRPAAATAPTMAQTLAPASHGGAAHAARPAAHAQAAGPAAQAPAWAAQPLREPPVLREEVAPPMPPSHPGHPAAGAPYGAPQAAVHAASHSAAHSAAHAAAPAQAPAAGGYWAQQPAPSLADGPMPPAPAPAAAAAATPPAGTARNLTPTGVAMNAQMMEELRNVRGLIEERFGAIAFLEKLQRSRSNAQLTQKLLDCGFSPALIRKMVDAMPAEVSDGSADEVAWATEVLERNLLTGEQELAIEDQGGVFALIGSTGVGKTTSTAKIAAAFAAKHGAANLGLITLDAYRVGAHEQLRAYGRILGVPVHTAHDRAALEDLLELLAAKKLILIDTAGIAQRDSRSRELLEMLGHPSIRKLVVVNASVQGETIDDVLVAYQANAAAGIVLSKLDEAVKLGPALDALIRHRLKVVGVANGQRVPEDWHRLSARALVHRALRSGGSPAYRLDPNEVNLVFTTPSANPAAMTAQMQAHAQAHLQAQAQQAQTAARRTTGPTGGF